MLKKAEDNYELLWEMVYHNPKEVKGTPARLLVKIAQCVIKAIRNKSSKYRCLKVFKVPFYSDGSY